MLATLSPIPLAAPVAAAPAAGPATGRLAAAQKE
jgi:hypothetical protein